MSTTIHRRLSSCVSKPVHRKSRGLRSKSTSLTINKRICLTPAASRRNSLVTVHAYSSDDCNEDDGSDDEGYATNQQKAMRMNMMRKSSFADPRILSAVCQYDDSQDKSDDSSSSGSGNLASPSSSSVNLASATFSVPPASFDLGYKSIATPSSIRLPADKSTKADHATRRQCFDYLVEAIDEAWARYCDSTAYDEKQAYDNDDVYHNLPNTPASLPSDTSDCDDDEDGQDYNGQNYDTDYTDASGSECDFFKARPVAIINNNFMMRKGSLSNDFSDVKKVSEYPRNLRLLNLKSRLIKCKENLSLFVDSLDANDATQFWRRWDPIKYEAIELVEDTDDDDVIDEKIDELERGRLYGCF